MKNAEREYRIKQLWLDRHKEERTGDHVSQFCQWLKENHPTLVPKLGGGDVYQHIKVVLLDHTLPPL